MKGKLIKVGYRTSSLHLARDWIVVDLIDLLLLLLLSGVFPPSILRRRMDDWAIECGGLTGFLSPPPLLAVI